METLCLCCSFLLIFFLYPSVGYFPLNADSYKPPKCVLPNAYRSSGTAPLWVLFTRCNSSGTDCSSMDTPQQRFHDKSAIYGLLSMGKSSYQEPSPGWALYGVTENRCLLLCGTLHGLQGGCLPLLSSPCTAGQSLLWHLEHFTAPQLL